MASINLRKESNSYIAIYDSKLGKSEEPFSNVIGHESQKRELSLVVDWFSRSKELKERGVSIPKGVILLGAPGNGKSLFMKDITKCAGAPVFVFKGEENNIVGSLIETFNKAKETGHAIIILDEIDLLIAKDRRVIRAFQENLDGVESSDDILVLAATNYISEIPEALLRSGRFEKRIFVPNPTGLEALELMKKHFKEFKVEFPEVDEEDLCSTLLGTSFADIKYIVNDIVLRNGFEIITER